MEDVRIVEIEKAAREDCQELLLLADPSWEMVMKYLKKGTMLALWRRGRVVAEAVYSQIGEGLCELHNLAVLPEEQGKGYGRRLLKEVEKRCFARNMELQVGTAVLDPEEKTFYEKNGFCFSHVVKNFFTDHYNPPPVDNGVECVDMVYFRNRK